MSVSEVARTDPQVTQGFELSGDLDIASTGQARNRLERAISDTPSGPVLVDLAHVTFMDCRGLSLLVWAHNVLGDRLVLGRPSSAVTRLLDLTGLRKTFMIADD